MAGFFNQEIFAEQKKKDWISNRHKCKSKLSVQTYIWGSAKKNHGFSPLSASIKYHQSTFSTISTVHRPTTFSQNLSTIVDQCNLEEEQKQNVWSIFIFFFICSKTDVISTVCHFWKRTCTVCRYDGNLFLCIKRMAKYTFHILPVFLYNKRRSFLWKQ
jgi:hypothetical protein